MKSVKNIQAIIFLVLISKNKTKGKSKYATCLAKRTFIHEIEDKYDLEIELEVYLQFLLTGVMKRSMLTYCVKCRKNTENLNSKIFKTKNGRLIMQSKYADCGIKRSRFVKEQDRKGLLSNLGIKKPLNKIPLLNVLF